MAERAITLLDGIEIDYEMNRLSYDEHNHHIHSVEISRGIDTKG
mgnify:CR=1 FL=1